MILIDALMVITVLSTGLFTGLLMTVVFFFQKALRGKRKQAGARKFGLLWTSAYPHAAGK